MRAIVHAKPEPSPPRSLEVVRTYLQKGPGATRSFWVKISPKSTLAKIILLPPLFLIGSVLVFLLLVIFGLAWLVLSLSQAASKPERH